MLKWWIAIMMVMATLLLWQQPWRQDAVAATKVTAAMVDSLTAVATPAGMVNVHVDYDAFCVDFNPTAHRPNCTAYVLTREHLNGTVARHDQFTADDRVTGCPPPNAYRGSGLARGHMVPAADMAWNETAMAQTFFMTNVCPQSSALNSGGWSKLEEHRLGAAVQQCGGSRALLQGGDSPHGTPPDAGHRLHLRQRPV